jgi:hypothetical protein
MAATRPDRRQNVNRTVEYAYPRRTAAAAFSSFRKYIWNNVLDGLICNDSALDSQRFAA